MDRYSHLVHAGAQPTPQEYASILAAKQGYEARRATLRNEARQLEVRLDEARKELDILESEIEAHARLISPLRRIPPEILRDIFAHAAPPFDSVHPDVDRVLHAPWTTMEVCKHWKEICLQYGSLWSQVVTDTGNPADWLSRPPVYSAQERPMLQNVQQAVSITARQRTPVSASYVMRVAELLGTQLRRSKDADLRVVLKIGLAYDYGQPFLRILLPHLHRASSLTAPYHVLAEIATACPFSRLAQVQVDYPPLGRELPPAQHLSKMKRFFTDTSLTAIGAFIRPPYTGASLDKALDPFRSVALTRLAIHHDQCWELLRPVLPQFRNVVHLDLVETPELQLRGQPRPARNPAPIPDPITFPRLRDLSVKSLTNLSEVLSCIRAPSLRRLTCHGVDVPSLTSVQEFILQSNCQLHALDLHAICEINALGHFFTHMADSSALEFLHSLQIIRHYTVGLLQWDPSNPENESRTADTGIRGREDDIVLILELLSRVDDQGAMAILPRLHSLALRYAVIPANVLIDMLELRRRTGLAYKMASCSLVDAYSPYPRLSASDFSRNGLEIARQRSRAYWGIAGEDPPSNSALASKNKRLSWRDDLVREPEQKARLDLLQEGGLELWM